MLPCAARPAHLDAEGEGAGVRGDQPAAGRLRDDGDLAAVAAAQGGEGPEAAVLLADDAVQGQPPLGAHPGAVQRAGDGEVDGDAGLHVAGAPAVEHAVLDARRERVCAPVQFVRSPTGTTSTCPWSTRAGLPVAGRRADDAVSLDPGRLAAGELRVAAQLVEVQGPGVDLEPGLVEPPGDRVLQVGLGIGAGDARDPDELDEGGTSSASSRASSTRRSAGSYGGVGPGMHGTVCRAPAGPAGSVVRDRSGAAAEEVAMGTGHGHDHPNAGATHRWRLRVAFVLVAASSSSSSGRRRGGSLRCSAMPAHGRRRRGPRRGARRDPDRGAPGHTGRRTFGSYRAEVFASGLAVLLMLGVAAYIVVAAVGRIGDEPEVASTTMLVVGLLGLVVNLVALALLRGGAAESLNVKGAYLEVVADTVGSLGVVVAGLLVSATGSSVWDTGIALAIAVFVAVRAVLLGREVLAVLGQHAPAGMVPADAEAALRARGCGRRRARPAPVDPHLGHARGDRAPRLRRRRRPDDRCSPRPPRCCASASRSTTRRSRSSRAAPGPASRRAGESRARASTRHPLRGPECASPRAGWRVGDHLRPDPSQPGQRGPAQRAGAGPAVGDAQHGLVAIDATILAAAVPAVVRDLGGFSQFPWLFSVYLLAQAVSVPIYGKVADLYGRKPVMLLGIALFLVGSLLCGLAWSWGRSSSSAPSRGSVPAPCSRWA